MTRSQYIIAAKRRIRSPGSIEKNASRMNPEPVPSCENTSISTIVSLGCTTTYRVPNSASDPGSKISTMIMSPMAKSVGIEMFILSTPFDAEEDLT